MLDRKLLRSLWIKSLAFAWIGAGAFMAAPASADDGWLGVSLQELNDQIREAMDLEDDVEGALVAAVADGSPADRAGVREGDILLSLGDEEIDSVDEAVKLVRDLDPGDRLDIEVLRGSSRRSLTATVGTREDADIETLLPTTPPSPPTPPDEVRDEIRERDSRRDNDALDDEGRDQGEDDEDEADAPRARRYEAAPRAEREIRREARAGAFLGVRTFELGSQLADYFDLDENEGVLVTEVVEDSPAAKAGLRAGDVILAVENDKVSGPDKLRRLIRSHDPDETVQLAIQRKGNRMNLDVRLGSPRELGDLGIPFAPRAMYRREMAQMGRQMREEMRGLRARLHREHLGLKDSHRKLLDEHRQLFKDGVPETPEPGEAAPKVRILRLDRPQIRGII